MLYPLGVTGAGSDDGKWKQERVPTNYKAAILSDAEFRTLNVPRRDAILDGLIVEESITTINGFRGHGKSWLALAIANEVSWGGHVAMWKANGARNVMYIDGEMAIDLMQTRNQLLNIGRNIQERPAQIFWYSDAYGYLIGLNRANILDEKWRKVILDQIHHLDIGLLILDNLSSLAPGIDENEKLDFDPVNQWLIEVRFHGVSIVILHHMGKGGQQRGTSAHEDNINTSLLLTQPQGYKPEMGCSFRIETSKDREFIVKGLPAKFQLVGDATKGERLSIDVAPESNIELVLSAIRANPDLTVHEAVEELKVSASTFWRAKKQLREEGELQ